MTTPVVTANGSMRGASAARRHVADLLTANIPAQIGAFRTAWGLDTDSLPDPQQILPYPLTIDLLDRWPSICVASMRTASIARVSYNDPTTIDYRNTYAMRVYTWVSSVGWETIFDRRDDYSRMVLTVLLDQPSLGRSDALIEEQEMTEEFSDIQRVRGDMFVAGAYVGFNLTLDESIDQATSHFANLGNAAQRVSIAPVGYSASHPALG